VEDVRWWGAASVTTGAEHPLVFPLTTTGVWGHPPDKQLNAVNQPTSFGNVVGKQGTGGKETLSTCSGSGRTAPDTTPKNYELR